MIKEIFAPEKIGSYYLFSKRIVGIQITKTHIYATKLYVSGNKVTVQKMVQEKIGTDFSLQEAQEGGEDPISQALSIVLAGMVPFDEVRSAIPSSVVVCKELRLPFVDREKIKMVVLHEVEPLLPFPIFKAVTDFIVTADNKEEKSSDVVTATVQKSYMEAHLNQYQGAGVHVDVVTMDMFALYGLWKLIPAYQNSTGTVFIVDIGFESTRIVYIENKQLRSIRNISQGIFTVAKKAATETNQESQALLEIIMRSGLDLSSQEDQVSVRKAFDEYLGLIGLTISSFAKDRDTAAIEHILITGEGAILHGLTEIMSTALHVPCLLMDGSLIASIPNISILNRSLLTPTLVTSLAIAFPDTVVQDFTFRKEEFQVKHKALFVKQIAATAFLTLFFLGFLSAIYVARIQSLEFERDESSDELISVIKKQFPRLEKYDEDAEEMVALAKKELEKEKETWFAFSLSLQSRFLHYLLELTNRIDKNALDFVVEQITITEGVMILKAQVKNYEALKILERELRQSPLFIYVEPQDSPRFSMKINLASIKEQ